MSRMVATLVSLSAICLASAAALAQVPDWEVVADVDTIQVVTQNEDGTKLDTTVWLAVVGEQGYVRTGSTQWGDNALREPEVELRIDDERFQVQLIPVEDEQMRGAIEDAFREKYGFMDALIGLFRGEPLILRVTSR